MRWLRWVVASTNEVLFGSGPCWGFEHLLLWTRLPAGGGDREGGKEKRRKGEKQQGKEHVVGAEDEPEAIQKLFSFLTVL